MKTSELDILVDLAQTGSLTAAAKRKGIAVSTAVRRLDALEARWKLRLVDRRMNGARLTPQGERLAALSERAAEGFSRVERAAAAMRQVSEFETVVISATEFIVSDVLAPALPRIIAKSPNLKIGLQSQASLISLPGREADIAIRMSRPAGNSLIAKRLGELGIGP